jgi:hypothetical protein
MTTQPRQWARALPGAGLGFALALAVSLPARAGDNDDISSVMTSINVEANQHAGNVFGVNGSVHIGDGAAVGNVGSVNGSIHIDDNAHITGMVSTVNGSVHFGSGADITGKVSTVNGSINLDGAHVAGGISTLNGSTQVGANSKVEGGIHYQPENSDDGWFGWIGALWPSKPPRVVIEHGAVVSGTLNFEREVRLYVSDRATIGPVKGATAIKFSGDHPPD